MLRLHLKCHHRMDTDLQLPGEQESALLHHNDLQVIDLESGDIVHWLRIEGKLDELYDTLVLPGVTRPKALGFKTDEIRHNVWIHDSGRPAHWTGQEKGH